MAAGIDDTGEMGAPGDGLGPGIYDTIVDAALAGRLDDVDVRKLRTKFAGTEPAELAERIAEVVRIWFVEALNAVRPDERGEVAKELTGRVLTLLQEGSPSFEPGPRQLNEALERLIAIEHVDPTGTSIPVRRPLTPLRDTVLMANAPGQAAVGREIAAEIESADAIDVVLAFIRWSGIRDLLEPLRRHVQAGRPLRVITTTYTGSTEVRALQALVEIGAQVRVSYDVTSTRLHAKAWSFHRASGFSTVYIGSSNLTFSAQVTGREWNVRAAESRNPDLTDGFQRIFDTYWADPHFEDFDAEQFERATTQAVDDSILTPFAIEPYPFQRQILEELTLERSRGRHNNLVVAATGTGKTVVAALDYRQLRKHLERSRLLFVAHRKEILQRSRDTFRHVLRDGNFGELWVDGVRPQHWDHVFASIQSLSASDARDLDPAAFDVVIVDEFHHAAAATYTALLDHLTPRQLLGLTATPERADGLDILRWFDGRMAIELRLWDALEQDLLSPFHYYGIYDGTDLSGVTWRGGQGYDRTELTNLYTADHAWVSKVIRTVTEKIGQPTRMRALGFGVTIAHCEFLAEQFTAAGIDSRVVSARTPRRERDRALDDLRAGNVQVLFSVDVFNEGIDVPAADTILMLRPTESATVFLQQLGRGLRKSDGKDVCTVLDFVGHQTRQFRFDLRYRRMLGRTRRQLENDLEEGFPYLPAGCELQLDEVARDIVLKNVRDALPQRWPARVTELRALGDVSLREYLAETGLELEDVYQGNHTFTEMRRDAGVRDSPARADEDRVGRGIARLLHVDDLERIESYIDLLSNQQPPSSPGMGVRLQRQLQGLLLSILNPKKNTFASLDEATTAFWEHPGLREELISVLDQLRDRLTHLTGPLGILEEIPLRTHATYTREEILGAFGVSTVSEPLPLQAGVYWDATSLTDLLFITLEKSEKDYSPTTRYRDYAISDRLFHWETQSTTRVHSETGQRYLQQRTNGTNVVLFIRSTKLNPYGRTRPYFCAGRARYVEHRSERPIQIVWELVEPLPGDVFSAFRAAVA